MMAVSVGTFNLNNLFSRFNFSGVIDAIEQTDGAPGSLTIRYEFTNPNTYRIRTFRGRLVVGKTERQTQRIAERIVAMNLDVLAVQEVEDIDILKRFNDDNLGDLYDHVVLLEGNDPRFIDVGLLSKLPLGAVTSFQTAVHPETGNTRVFGRDLLEVEILNANRTRKLFTLYNTHLKSHFGDDRPGGRERNDNRRRRQAEAIRTIVARRQRSNARYLILGDMNDPPTAAPLTALLDIEGAMVNGLAAAQETRPAPREQPGNAPASPIWTHRFRPRGQPPRHELLDHIWLSPALAPRLQGAFIERRTLLTGNGSDHDPAWVVLDV